jgi:hypothetical protein
MLIIQDLGHNGPAHCKRPALRGGAAPRAKATLAQAAAQSRFSVRTPARARRRRRVTRRARRERGCPRFFRGLQTNPHRAAFGRERALRLRPALRPCGPSTRCARSLAALARLRPALRPCGPSIRCARSLAALARLRPALRPCGPSTRCARSLAAPPRPDVAAQAFTRSRSARGGARGGSRSSRTRTGRPRASR